MTIETSAILPVVQEIKLILDNARHNVARQINNTNNSVLRRL